MRDWIKLSAYTAASLFILLSVAQFFMVFYLPNFIAQDLSAESAHEIVSMTQEDETSAVEMLDSLITSSTRNLYILDSLQLVCALVVIVLLIYVYNLKNIDESSGIEILEDTEEFYVSTQKSADQSPQEQSLNKLKEDSLTKEISKAYAYDPTDITDFGNYLCTNIAHLLEASQIALYTSETIDAHTHKLELIGSFAYHRPDTEQTVYEYGEGLVGQAAKSKKILVLDEVPKNYVEIVSGLGQSPPNQLIVIPLLENNECVGAFEIATFSPINSHDQKSLIDCSKKLIETITLFS